ncbi:MAG: LysR family transcriptional regulator [Lachnospiraceae bacterium]|nr:LysR family transcriptional regulator [Lachnospiraceae bacterium]MBR1524736.1 LysR family transcriptional regulator [Lachnospiraceae bacterium]
MSVSSEHYKIFYYVGKYKSFSQAARVLLNSQSNISRTIANLENELGCKLFIRMHDGIRLTEEGDILYRHAAVAFEHLQLGEEELLDHLALHSNSIRIGYSIGISDSLLNTLFFPVIKDYYDSHEGVRLHVKNDSTPKLVSDINEGLLDLAIITSYEDDRTINGKLLDSFREELIAGKVFEALKEKELTLKDISAYPIICAQRGSETHQVYEAFFAEHGLVFEPSIETATSDQVLMLVQSNLGIGFVESGMFNKYADKENAFKLKLKEEPPLRGVYLLANEFRKENEEVSALLQMF